MTHPPFLFKPFSPKDFFSARRRCADNLLFFGRIDMFWPGMIAVEQKSRSKNLVAATEQCLIYLRDKDIHELSTHIEHFAFLAGYDQRRYGTVTE